MNMTRTPYRRITWISRLPDVGSTRIYADVWDGRKATHMVKEAKPPATELPMTDAVAAVQAYVDAHPGVSADHVLDRASLMNHGLRPLWHFSWPMREHRVTGGGIFLTVGNDGRILASYGM
ncbi:MAG: hypothetical protein HN742_29790 [Lentisphaerae bacterium]|nr:hypothetical protein [Lentisphaerota bacterium]MBT5608308.1 hypothetical protein [Lentisphaerota bacterium]MBT7061792.1 hypothetical protein [Lentisphaerota bacterium]MBT7846101.1 hypothetical protein [Lentisphaerota bacterium]